MSLTDKIVKQYTQGVIESGDDASEKIKNLIQQANSKTTLAKYFDKNWQLKIENQISKVSTSIDGVGTKVRIYTAVFEWMRDLYTQNEVSKQKLVEISIELWKRCFRDMAAMNLDDLRDGQVWIALTDIIDINHLDWEKWQIFKDSFSIAVASVVEEIDVPVIAGETAILGDSEKVEEIYKVVEWFIKKIESYLWGTLDNSINNIINNYKNEVGRLLSKIEFNLSWTALGVLPAKEKLISQKEGQKIVALLEKPTSSGIIGPRANGITLIRKLLSQKAWPDWIMLTFEQFLDRLSDEEKAKIPSELKQNLSGLYMWDIATWKTTIFNKFVSRVVLGGLESDPQVGISWIVHVTGNPLRKIKEWIKDSVLSVTLDLSNVQKPQIIQLLQAIDSIPDEVAIKSWNMGVPYMLFVEAKDIDKLSKFAQENGFDMQVIWELKKWNKSTAILADWTKIEF